MRYELSSASSFPMVQVILDSNEEIQVESGSIVFYDDSIKIEGKVNNNGKRGIAATLKALGNSIASGENLYITKVRSIDKNSKITIAPKSIGTIKGLTIGQEQWFLNRGSFLASDGDIHYTVMRQKVSEVALGVSDLFVMKTQGQGTMLVSGYGDVIEIELDGSEGLTIDNNHVLAWSENLSYSIGVASGKIGYKTGEGLVNKFKGKGKILIQSRNIESLAKSIISFLPNQH